MTSQQYAMWQERQRAKQKQYKPNPNPADAFMPVVNGEREKDLHEAIAAECLRRNWLCFHGAMHRKSHRTLGEADLTIAADKGRVFFIECKSKEGKMRPDQLVVAAVLKRLGQNYAEVRSFAEFLSVVDK